MTIGSIFKKPETILYPVVTKPMPEGLKGHVVNHPESCILCNICEKRCPTGSISVDKDARSWSINPFSCVQCQSCVLECPRGALTMEPTYTPPSTEKYVDTLNVPEHPKGGKIKHDEAVNVNDGE